MNFRLPALVRTTTFKLAILHAALFAVFVVALLFFLYVTTFGFVSSEADRRLQAEVTELTTAYRTGGLIRLNQSVLERRSVPGLDRFFYLLLNSEGQKIQGDLSALPADVSLGAPARVAFSYDVPLADGRVSTRAAEGRMALMDDGSTLFVAYDVADNVGILPRLGQAVWMAAPIGLLMSFVGGVIISRTAAQRADALAKTADAVMAGDLARRAPEDGSDDEFDRLAKSQNAMLARIQKLMDSSRHVGDAIAHDLRSPLTRLRNRLEGAMQDTLDPDQAREVVGDTIIEVDQVLGTFNAILSLSRLEAGDQGSFVRLDIGDLASEIAELYEPACEEADISFTNHITPDIAVKGDRGMLAQALANLLDNGVKYTPAGGSLTLEVLSTETGEVELIVTDSGPGIPAADRARVTERFYRLEASRSEPGSGLGLSLVEAVADVHKGALEFDDGFGPRHAPGLRAILRLPLA